ncbi:hypothetical protein [Phenylobacterium sp.]|uniref:hypothetical protein n=1 Tax=Phenylobacterium sp. TaxID=1871053 RepID=UPI002736264F|nr:hypothetical protein [Phenylobacterium sp.]MDP3855133.1 hypothetical protein [Phenylobacterium sp.]
MTEYSDYTDDNLAEAPEAEVVHWMDRRPLTIGAAGFSGAVAGAFLLGAAAALGLVVLSSRVSPRPRWNNPFSRSIH